MTQSPPVSLNLDIQSLSCIFISRAFFQYFIQISVWFVLEVGPVFGRGLDLVHPRERPQLWSRLQYHHQSPRQYLRSLRGFVDTRHGWDPGPHHLYLRGELGGDIITSAVACLQDQEAVVRREPHSGECTTPSQTVPSGVVLRRPSTEG